MLNKLNAFLDNLSEFLAHRKGLLPLLGILMVITNAILQFFVTGWLVETDILLHLGVVLGIFGVLLGRAL